MRHQMQWSNFSSRIMIRVEKWNCFWLTQDANQDRIQFIQDRLTHRHLSLSSSGVGPIASSTQFSGDRKWLDRRLLMRATTKASKQASE